ncbi:MAG: prenyltransferase/squalene oxidase repeat-containing protein [Thermoguttaceae bacterium]
MSACVLVLPCAAAETPAAPVLEGPKPKAVAAPPREQIDAAVQRGIAFLLKRQNANGSWGSSRSSRPMEVYAPIPESHHAFRAGVTALCVSALIETGGGRPETEKAIDRGEAWLLESLPSLRRATTDVMYNNWSHAYAIDTLTRLLRRHPQDAERGKKIRALIEHQIGMLGRYECVEGGWAYYDMKYQTAKPSGPTISFVTATVLVALDAARQAGISVPQRLVNRGVASILRQRKPDFSYDYGEYLKYRPMMPINRPGGSLGRSQACNLALRLWGDRQVTDAVLQTWLDRLFARNLWLDLGRKRPIPHESWFQVAGYFFYYGHYYAALCIEQLPAGERAAYQDQLATVLLRVQEKDGSWWDFPLYDYHQQYGTAFALMSLARCQHGK